MGILGSENAVSIIIVEVIKSYYVKQDDENNLEQQIRH